MQINCKQASEYIIKKEENKLSMVQRWQLWRHLIVCKACKLFYLQNNIITKALRKNKESNKVLSSTDKELIITAIQQEHDFTKKR